MQHKTQINKCSGVLSEVNTVLLLDWYTISLAILKTKINLNAKQLASVYILVPCIILVIMYVHMLVNPNLLWKLQAIALIRIQLTKNKKKFIIAGLSQCIIVPGV